MRPLVSEETEELYECFSCGERVGKTETLVCEHCDGELLHLGRSRDL